MISSMRIVIVAANERHRSAINRLLWSTKIGPSYGREASLKNIWVAKGGRRVIGFQAVDFWRHGAAILVGGAVEKEYRRQGVGSLLMGRALKEARKRKVSIVALLTMYYWFRFCKKRGFQTCPRKNLPDAVATYPQFTSRRYMKCAVMIQYL